MRKKDFLYKKNKIYLKTLSLLVANKSGKKLFFNLNNLSNLARSLAFENVTEGFLICPSITCSEKS